MPCFIKPQLATLKSRAPKGDQWLHEIKYDGLPQADVRSVNAALAFLVYNRTQTAHSGYEEFISKHTYKHRIEKILEIVK